MKDKSFKQEFCPYAPNGANRIAAKGRDEDLDKTSRFQHERMVMNMKHRNWFWGIFFLAAAVFVIAVQIGAFVQIGFWSIGATVLLAAVFISSLLDLNFFGIFISLALLYPIYQQPLHLVSISIWLLLLAAVLASMGFSMIFHSHRHHWAKCDWHDHWDRHNKLEENIDGNDIFVKSSFNESCKYLHADSLKKAHLASSFGKLSVYFDQVQLSAEGAEASIDVSFGEMTLYLSKNWRVADHVSTGIGAVSNDNRNMPPDANAPTLTLTGRVSFGSLEIHYV